MTDKICTFCKGIASYSPIEEMEAFNVKIYFCYDCQAEYVYLSKDECSFTSLYTEIDERMFRWSVSSRGTAAIWRIIDPGIPGIRKNGKNILVKHFDPKYGDTIQSLTPQNVNQKLRVWITFL